MRLAVVPDNTPLPMTMLSKLWQLPGQGEAEKSANMLQQLGIMRVAFLYDGSAWALVDTGHLKHLQVGLPTHSSPAVWHELAHMHFASVMLQQDVGQCTCRKLWSDLSSLVMSFRVPVCWSAAFVLCQQREVCMMLYQ